MKGKEKCSLLKKIRRMIAKKNGIPYETEECTATGDCKGYCPKCDQEIEELSKALQEKESKKKGSTKIPKVSKKNLSFESEKEREPREDYFSKRMRELEERIESTQEKFRILREEAKKLQTEAKAGNRGAEIKLEQIKQQGDILQRELRVLQDERQMFCKEILSHQTLGIMEDFDPSDIRGEEPLMGDIDISAFDIGVDPFNLEAELQKGKTETREELEEKYAELEKELGLCVTGNKKHNE
jgi:hypothetical protein